MGEYFEVLADTGRALKIEKENIDSLILRGNAYYKLGEFDMSIRHYRQVVFHTMQYTNTVYKYNVNFVMRYHRIMTYK